MLFHNMTRQIKQQAKNKLKMLGFVWFSGVYGLPTNVTTWTFADKEMQDLRWW